MNKTVICVISVVGGIAFGMYQAFSAELDKSRKRCSSICIYESGRDEYTLSLDCGHEFHQLCIRAWQKVNTEECPLCKKDPK
ncbi:E3 ubiquitin-protein ligase AIRP1-like [Cephus cinctus]|uniref:E3 ubiquitin-protein ligase AIRP1-like n=1 Tax=Cephus cinctus TaxID=211228 RepID=A0AAJ7RPA4_CEPCN|nr:E3 ubiquitin-protein ligase AIRP1-like [Cephus cinctus]